MLWQEGSVLANAGPPLTFCAVRVLALVQLVLCVAVGSGQTSQPSCGKPHELVDTRIHRGETAQIADWPWHAAIYHRKEASLAYTCGGSIIHTKIILSAAHCFYSQHRRLSENQIAVHAGRQNLHEVSAGLQVLGVLQLLVHPDFRLRSVAHDVALVRLSNDVALTRLVQPVCLWSMADDQGQGIVGRQGTMLGYGLNERDELPGVLQEANLTVVSGIACLVSDRAAYGAVLSDEVYCAGGRQGVGACNGDSGGGMFFEVDGTWYVRGIVALSPKRSSDSALCDSSKYTVFTDVGKYRRWISDTIDWVERQMRFGRPCNDTAVRDESACNAAHRFDHGFLLVQERNKTFRVPLDGGRSFLVAEGSSIVGIGRDCAAGRFYWADSASQQIASVQYDGTDRQPFVTEDISSPLGMAVDWISRRIYWTNWRRKVIAVASMEDPELRTVIVASRLVKPYAIAVDPVRGKLFWSDNGAKEPKIEWSNLDGTERQLLAGSPAVQLPLSIQVSAESGELCYADAGSMSIVCIEPYSKQVRTIATNLTTPIGLTLTGEMFYWINQRGKTIESISRDGVRQEPITSPIFEGTLLYMTDVTDRCPIVHSPCAVGNGECPGGTICLANPRAPLEKVCKCTRDCE